MAVNEGQDFEASFEVVVVVGGGGVKGNQQSDALVYEKHQYLNKIQKCSLNVVHMFMAFQ